MSLEAIMGKRKAEGTVPILVDSGDAVLNATLKKKRKTEGAAAESGQPAGEIDHKLSKKEYKERKRLKQEKKARREKAQAEEQNPAANAKDAAGQDVPEEVDITVEDGIATDKADKSTRKAEERRLKAEKKARDAHGAGLILPEVGIANGNSATTTSSNGAATETLCYTQDPSLTALPQTEITDFLSSSHITISDSTSSTLRPIISFSQLPPSAQISPSPFANFKKPTPIQSAAWPFLLSDRDVIGIAETGSGKTLAFGVPCVRHISSILSTSKKSKKGGAARAVIVSPTRELAVQIYNQMVLVAKPAGLEAVCVYGGVPKDSQRHMLKTAQIVVATPGRLNDLIEEGSANLSNVSYLVLDEADRMLDKGFEQEIRKIVDATTSNDRLQGAIGGRARQTLMFTATWPPSVRELAATFMRSPVRINIGEDNPTGELRANNRIRQIVEVVDPRGKEQRLLQILKKHQSGASKQDRILVFCLYKKEATRVEGFLSQRGLAVAGIHGDLSQERRTRSLEGFRSGDTPLLVATDVAARGLDIPDVKLVINVTFPLTVEDYVHRIGRCVIGP